MSKPSWFDSSNNISELSVQAIPTDDPHPVGSPENLRRVRCLWLISFIQDMRTFLASSPELLSDDLRQYTALQDALLLLRADMKRHMRGPSQEQACSPHEFARLACLFFISVFLQASALDDATAPHPSPSNLAIMDAFLQARDTWSGSVDNLYFALFHHFAGLLDNLQKKDYVLQMTNVLASLSSEARRGVEKCLLHILCQVENNAEASSFGDWTPDNLLSSVRGL
jgi:hypothetical protein